MTIVATAAEAFDRYNQAFEQDRLIQSGWHHIDEDGRHLACALGVLGDEVRNSLDCPANIMPRWLARMVPWLFNNMEFETAKRWGLDFYAELARLGGKVPFAVVYDWHASVTTRLAIEWREAKGRGAKAHRKLQALHLRALAGDRAPKEEWRAVLRDASASVSVYADAYAYAYASVYAAADADAYAYAYADASVYADADAYAYAYACADDHAGKYLERVTALAFGLVECLKRVEAA